MVESSSIAITPKYHADRHVVGGLDPLVSPIVTTAHHATHEPGGSDALPFFTYENTTNFAITTSTAWADLDLSSVVGANRALVLLRINNTAGSTDQTYAIREKGDTGEYEGDFTLAGGLAMANIDHSKSGLLMCVSDTSGIIQMRGSHASALQSIYVVAYVVMP